MASKLITSGKWGKRGSFMRALPEASRREISGSLLRVAQTIQIDAASRAPTRTGRLRRALRERTSIGTRDRGLEVEYGLRTKRLQRKAFYASFVEYGRRGYERGGLRLRTVTRSGLGKYRKVNRKVAPARARPFFRPAVQANIQLWRREMRAALQRAIRIANRG